MISSLFPIVEIKLHKTLVVDIIYIVCSIYLLTGSDFMELPKSLVP